MMTSLRVLSQIEIANVSGGLSDKPIVVSHPPYPGGYNPGEVNPVNPGSGGSGGTGTGGLTGSGNNSGGYSTSGATSEANNFADAHLSNKGVFLADQIDYQYAHDDLAKMYDYAKGHPYASFDVGNGQTMSYNDAIRALDHVQMVITSDATLAGATGAITRVNSDNASLTIYINPESSNQSTYDNTFNMGTGINYVVFHEIGHALNFFQPNGSFGGLEKIVEGSANTAGRSLEMALGIPLLARGSGLVEPGNGYV